MFYIIFFLLNQIIFIFSLKYAAVSTLTLSPEESSFPFGFSTWAGEGWGGEWDLRLS